MTIPSMCIPHIKYFCIFQVELLGPPGLIYLAEDQWKHRASHAGLSNPLEFLRELVTHVSGQRLDTRSPLRSLTLEGKDVSV